MNRIIQYGLVALQTLSPRDLANVQGREAQAGNIASVVSAIGSGASAVNSIVSSEPVAATSSALVTSAAPALTITPPTSEISDVGSAVTAAAVEDSSIVSGVAAGDSSMVAEVGNAISSIQIDNVGAAGVASSILPVSTAAPPATTTDPSAVTPGGLIVSDLSTGAAPIVSQLSTFINPVASVVSTKAPVTSAVAGPLETIEPGLGSVISGAGSAVGSIVSGVSSAIPAGTATPADPLDGLTTLLPTVTDVPLVGSIVPAVGSLVSKVTSDAIPLVTSVVPDIISSAVPGLVTGVVPNVVTGVVPNLVTGVVPNIVTGVVPDVITGVVPDLVTGVVPNIVTGVVPNIVTGIVPDLVTGVVPDLVSSIVPAIPGILSDLGGAVPTLLPGIASEASGLVGGVLSDIGSIATAAPGALGPELNSAINRLTSGLGQLGLQTAAGQLESELGHVNSLIAGSAVGGGQLASELGQLSSLIGGVTAQSNDLLAGLTAATEQTRSPGASATAFESLGTLQGSQVDRRPSVTFSNTLNSAEATGSVTGLFGSSGSNGNGVITGSVSGVDSQYPKSVLSFISNSISTAASAEVLSGSITTTFIRSVTFPISSLVPAPSNTAYPATVFPSGYNNPLDAQGNELKGAPIRSKTILAPLMPIAAVLIFGPLLAFWLCLRRRQKAKRSRAGSEENQSGDNDSEENRSGPVMVEIEPVAELGSGRSTRYVDSDSGSNYDNLSIRDADSFFDSSSIYAASVPEMNLLPRNEEAEKRRNVKFMRSNLKGFIKGGKHRYLQLLDDPNEDKEAEEGNKWFRRKKK